MAESLRDQLTAAFDKAEPQVEPVQAEPIEEPKQETRARGEDGKFVPKEKVEQNPDAQVDIQAEAPKPAKRPQSWKKDYWEHFDKLDPNLQQYILQREDEQTRGISNFKAEAERAKKLWDAIAPFQPELEQYGIAPEQHIQTLFNAHRTLALADPQSKISMFAKLAQDYGVPLQALVQGQTGQQMDPYVAQLAQQVNQLSQSWTQAQQQAVEQQQQQVANEVQEFAGNTERFPHFEQVRLKMAGLLQAGMADDLESAYEQAVRLEPEIFEQMMQAKQTEQIQAEKKAKDDAAKAAKAKAVSVAGSTPGPQAATGVKGIRANLEAAFDQHVSGGRI